VNRNRVYPVKSSSVFSGPDVDVLLYCTSFHFGVFLENLSTVDRKNT